jgi:DNA-binding MarR family transcriptional regulator
MGKIAAEIRQSRPFDSAAREMAVTLIRTGDVLQHAVESALRPFDISPAQYNVLRILRGARPEGLPCLEMAARMVARSPNITRLVDKMVAKGLAERHAIPGDRRVVRISATARGRALLGRLEPAIEATLAKVKSLPARDLQALTRLLDAVRERLAIPTVREGAERKAARRKKP